MPIVALFLTNLKDPFNRASIILWFLSFLLKHSIFWRCDGSIIEQEERHIVGHDGEHVHYVHPVHQELKLARRACKPEEILQGEPGDADRLHQGKLGVVDGLVIEVKVLEGRHGVEDHANGGDDHKQHGDGGHGLGCHGCVRLLEKVPQELLINHKFT